MAAPIIFLGFAALLVLSPGALAQAPAPAPAGPLNLTAILVKGGQYTSLLRLLNETQVGIQIQSQLNNSFNGLTVFAPTDTAFQNLKPGTLNSLSPQDQVNLVLYHVLPRYYSDATFQTASNPVRTQASDADGPYVVNITSTSNQVNVSTGIVETQLNNKLYSDFPLAVYSVDRVLMPLELFGAKPPAAAPAPSEEPKAPAKGRKTPAAGSPDGQASADQSTTPSAAVSLKGAWTIVSAVAASALTVSLL